jgi:RNA polymerase sigma-70 factor, ECF subfamily
MSYNDAIKNPHINLENISAFREIYFKYHSRLVLFANKFTGDMQISKDLVQDAFISLWQKNFNEKIVSPKDYLFQTVKNNCLNYHRHFNIKTAVEKKLVEKIHAIEKSVLYSTNDPFQSLLEHEIQDIVIKIIQSMPVKCREVYKLSRQDFMKNKQIAVELGISEKMVEKHITKALTFLRRGLSDYLIVLLFFIFF